MQDYTKTSARVGSFNGPQHQYGLPVSVVKPPDNVIAPVGAATAGGTPISSSPNANLVMDQSFSDFQTLMAQLATATA